MKNIICCVLLTLCLGGVSGAQNWQADDAATSGGRPLIPAPRPFNPMGLYVLKDGTWSIGKIVWSADSGTMGVSGRCVLRQMLINKEQEDHTIHGSCLNSIAYDSTTSRIFALHYDNTITAYDYATAYPLHSVNTGDAVFMAYYPENGMIYTVGKQGAIRVYTSDLELVSTFQMQGISDLINDPPVAISGHYIAMASHQNKIYVFDINTGRETVLLNGLDAEVSALSGSPSSNYGEWGIGLENGLVILVDETGKIIAHDGSFNDEITGVAVSSKGKPSLLAAGDANGEVKLFSLPDMHIYKDFNTVTTRVKYLAFSPGNTLLAINWSDLSVYIDYANPAYVRAASAQLLDDYGNETATLERNARIDIEKILPGKAYVSSGGTKGWLNGEYIAYKPVSADDSKPEVTLAGKGTFGGRIFMAGEVRSAKALASVTVNGSQISFARRANDSWNFNYEGPAWQYGNNNWMISATDVAGGTGYLTVTSSTKSKGCVARNFRLQVLRDAETVLPNGVAAGVKSAIGEMLDASGISDNMFCLADGRRIPAYAVSVSGLSTLGAVPAPRISTYPSQLPMGVPVTGTPSASVPPEDALLDDVPLGVKDENAVAVIFGAKEYKNKNIPSVKFALNDAAAFKQYAMNTFGVPEENIIYVENPTQGDFSMVFGTEKSYEGKLYNYIKKGESNVYVYFSGHGAPDTGSGVPYFVPTDGDPDYVMMNGYPLDLFYANLARLPAKSMTVVLDACFSGLSASPQNKGSLLTNASPLALQKVKTPQVPEGITVFASAGPQEIASWDENHEHSLFTYYFLKGIHDEMQSGGKVKSGMLYEYARDRVSTSAKKMFGRHQTPVFAGNLKRVLAKKAKK